MCKDPRPDFSRSTGAGSHLRQTLLIFRHTNNPLSTDTFGLVK
ncbi:hypothetical protein ANACOL_04444 [Anaerotruncus colihominis DSM 17241]|uniref:Uncharacterized protein n=1 Tax=Anaerotruncus colihominis DSM 17241 TaxID=445972 RepID=B0PI00_9FIRM|nr:hypothetical protein ANACOL_04444 [Anaerotruncus colihominis DSM 17241]